MIFYSRILKLPVELVISTIKRSNPKTVSMVKVENFEDVLLGRLIGGKTQTR